jgi:hypothetical protein
VSLTRKSYDRRAAHREIGEPTYFVVSLRRMHVISPGWQAIPIFEHVGSSVPTRRQAWHPSLHSTQSLSVSPKLRIDDVEAASGASVVAGACVRSCATLAALTMSWPTSKTALNEIVVIACAPSSSRRNPQRAARDGIMPNCEKIQDFAAPRRGGR